MLRLTDTNINTLAYWSDIYSKQQYPTFDPNNMKRFECAAKLFKGSTCLDIGSGENGLLVAMRQLKISSIYRPFDIILGDDFNQLDKFQDKLFDTVYALEVIEHSEEPMKLLYELERIAKLRVVISFPWSDPLALYSPEHLWLMSEADFPGYSFEYPNTVNCIAYKDLITK